MTYRVVLSAPAKRDLKEIRDFIRKRSSARIAKAFTRALVEDCRTLAVFPMRGNVRPEMGPDHRVVGFRGRVSVHFQVKPGRVVVLGLTYAGWDWQQDASLTSVD